MDESIRNLLKDVNKGKPTIERQVLTNNFNHLDLHNYMHTKRSNKHFHNFN